MNSAGSRRPRRRALQAAADGLAVPRLGAGVDVTSWHWCEGGEGADGQVILIDRLAECVAPVDARLGFDDLVARVTHARAPRAQC